MAYAHLNTPSQVLIDLRLYDRTLPPPGFARYAEAVGDHELLFATPEGTSMEALSAGVQAGAGVPPPGMAAICEVSAAGDGPQWRHSADDIKAQIDGLIVCWRRKAV
jgi:hypothetical protein